MTENEAFKYLNHMLQMMEDEPPENIKNERDIKEWEDEHRKIKETLEISKNTLEELPRYRDLGTVDELAEMQVQYYHLAHQVKQFEKIGTIEEFKALKEKATPKKGIPYTSSNNHKFVECPSCHKDMDLYYDFCQHCGQSVDWGKSKT